MYGVWTLITQKDVKMNNADLIHSQICVIFNSAILQHLIVLLQKLVNTCLLFY